MIIICVVLVLVSSSYGSSNFHQSSQFTNDDDQVIAQVHQLEETVSSLQSQVQIQDQKYAAVLSSALAKLTETTDKLADTSDELRNTTVELETTNTALNNVKDDYQVLHVELSTLRTRMEKCEYNVTIISKEATTTRNHVIQLQSNLQNLENSRLDQTAAVEADLGSLRSDIASSKENLTSIKLEITQLKPEITKVGILQTKVDSLKSMAHTAQKDLKIVEAELRNISFDNNILKEGLTKAETEMISLGDKVSQLPTSMPSQRPSHLHVAFQAEESHTVQISNGMAIRFDSVKYTTGTDYLVSSGVFSAPVSGTYLFWFSPVLGGENMNVTVCIKSLFQGVLASAQKELGQGDSSDTINTIAVALLVKSESVVFTASSNVSSVIYLKLSSYGGVLLAEY